MIQRCKKCGVRKGSPHRANCVARQYPQNYPDSILYTTTTDSGWSASSPSSGGACDSGSSSSDSGSSGGGGCE